MFVHTLSLFVIRPNPCGSPNQVAVYVCVFNSVCENMTARVCVCACACCTVEKCRGVKAWERESRANTHLRPN